MRSHTAEKRKGVKDNGVIRPGRAAEGGWVRQVRVGERGDGLVAACAGVAAGASVGAKARTRSESVQLARDDE